VTEGTGPSELRLHLIVSTLLPAMLGWRNGTSSEVTLQSRWKLRAAGAGRGGRELLARRPWREVQGRKLGGALGA
jgi:hypothetical protein